MTQTQLAAAAGIPQAAISRLENGTRSELPPEQVARLAAALSFPQALFYEQEPLYRRPISIHAAAFRKKASVSARDEDAVVAAGNHYILHLRYLLNAVDLETEFPLLQFEVVSAVDAAGDHARSVSSASEAAAAVRASWQIGDGPLLSLTRYVEACGVIVILADFGSADVDGFTLRPVGLKPVIFLNANRPADRLRFSLAHEFGHVVLHAFPYDAMEKEANEFASALLMPEAGVRQDLYSGISIPMLGRLKLKWNVSIASLIYRAKSLGIISAHEATGLWIAMRDYRKTEPEEYNIQAEKTKLVGDLIKAHLNELGYSIADLAVAGKTFEQEFAAMHGLAQPPSARAERPRLRLVSSA